jgi:hypothetical protein
VTKNKSFVTLKTSSSSDESELSFIEEKDEESDAEAAAPFDEDEPPASPTNPLLVDLEDGGLSRKERRAQVGVCLLSKFDKDFLRRVS